MHVKKSQALSSSAIRAALSHAWDLYKGIRDRWKQKCTALQQAIEKKDSVNERAYERRVLEQRRLLESCVDLTLKHGHHDIVTRLGENPALLVVLYQFLADRFKDGEHTGKFVTSILRLMARFPKLDAAILEKTRLDKLVQRILKRGDDQGKALARQILSAAKHTSSENKGLVEVKDNDGIKTPIEVKDEIKPPPEKVKVVNVAAKPSGFFSSLKSASKKPGAAVKSEESRSVHFH